MTSRPEGYVPAAGHDWLLGLYDPMVRLLFREGEVKRALLAQASLRPGDRVLDVGCGTGTLAVLIKNACPGARVVGLDGDPKALARARKKADAAGLEIQLDEGLAYALPYADGSFDRIFCSMVLHHLTGDQQRLAVAEIRRVLAPGGSFHLLDFGRPATAWDRALSRLSHGHEGGDPVADRLLLLLRGAGFSVAEELSRRGTIAGSLWYYRAADLEDPSRSKAH